MFGMAMLTPLACFVRLSSVFFVYIIITTLAIQPACVSELLSHPPFTERYVYWLSIGLLCLSLPVSGECFILSAIMFRMS